MNNSNFADYDDRRYLYVLVRGDMANRHATVQGTHAALEQTRRIPLDKHPSLVYVKVKNEAKLKKVAKDFAREGIQFTAFIENYGEYENQITAMATEPLMFDDKRRDFMKKFQLLDT